jgi:hypothetical protein
LALYSIFVGEFDLFEDTPPLVIKPFENYDVQDDSGFRVNESNEMKNTERIDMKTTTARCVNVSLLPSTKNSFGVLTGF